MTTQSDLVGSAEASPFRRTTRKFKVDEPLVLCPSVVAGAMYVNRR